MEQRLRGQLALAHEAARFGDGQIIEGYEHEDSPLRRGQLGERLLDLLPLADIEARGIRRGRDLDLMDIQMHPPAVVAAAPPKVIGELVAGDAAQPGRAVGTSIEASALVDRGDERLLCQLLGQFDVPAGTDLGAPELRGALWQYSKRHQPTAIVSPRRGTHAPAEPLAKRTPKFRIGEAPVDREFPTETYVRVVAAAIEQHTIPYSFLAGGRRMHGVNLDCIADYEAAHHRPPLTAVVVSKQTGRPSGGMALTLARVGYMARHGESDDDLWRRALVDVFAYWKP